MGIIREIPADSMRPALVWNSDPRRDKRNPSNLSRWLTMGGKRLGVGRKTGYGRFQRHPDD